MYRYLILCFICCVPTLTTIAQITCPPVDTIMSQVIEICSQTVPDQVCLAQEKLTISRAGDSSTSPSLSEIYALATESHETAFLVHLDRDDIPLKIIATGAITLENTALRPEIIVTATRNVNVRQQPSVEASVIGSVTIRQDYTATGRLADNTWIQLRLDDGRTGWASAQFFVTREGFNQLEAMTPSTPPYLPMQSVTLQTEDCGLLLILARQPQDETIIFGVNGTQLIVDGILALTASDDTLTITSITGEHTVSAFGFETPLEASQQTTIPLSDSLSIAGIPTDPQDSDNALPDEIIETLAGWQGEP